MESVNIFEAASKGDKKKVRYFVEEKGVRLTDFDYNGQTAIHRAAEYGHLHTLKYFIEERNCNVDMVNLWDQSPVFLAAKNRHRAVIEYLVEERNANLTLIDHTRQNILYIAIASEDLILFNYVLDVRKVPLDINWKDNFGRTLAHRAADLNKYIILEYLVNEKNANINTVDLWGDTPLYSAVSRSGYEVSKFLMKHGADTEMGNDLENIPVHEIQDKRLIRIIEAASARRKIKQDERQRTRRSMIESLMRPQSSFVNDVWTERTLNDNSSSLVHSAGWEAPLRSSSMTSLKFQDFLVIAGTILTGDRRKKNRQVEHIASSPRETILDRIDPVAIDFAARLNLLPNTHPI